MQRTVIYNIVIHKMIATPLLLRSVSSLGHHFATRLHRLRSTSRLKYQQKRDWSLRLRKEEEGLMDTVGILGSRTMFSSSPAKAGSPFFVRSMATQKPGTKVPATKKGSTVFPVGEPGPRQLNSNGLPPIKLLTNVEKLRLLTKAEKAGLLTTAENFGLSLSAVEKLGLLSKAEELGVLSAATDPATPGTLLSISLALLALGPIVVYVVPEQYPWEVALQVIVALVSVLGGSAAFAASTFVTNLQKSN